MERNIPGKQWDLHKKQGYLKFSDLTQEQLKMVVPNGKVMDTGDTTFKDDAIAAASLTLQAFPDANGAAYYLYTDDGVRL